MQLSTQRSGSNLSTKRQNFQAHTHTLSRFAVKANPQPTKKNRSIVRTITSESISGSRDEDFSKLPQESQTSRRDALDLNKKIADDTLLPPSMREPGAKKMGATNESNSILCDNIGLPSTRSASNKKHADLEELKAKVLSQKIFKTDSGKTSTNINNNNKQQSKFFLMDKKGVPGLDKNKGIQSNIGALTQSIRQSDNGDGGVGGGGDGHNGGNSDDDESDFDPDAFSIAETRILWIDRVYRDAYDIVLRTKQRMINIWITRDPSKTTRLLLFSVSGVSLFVLSLILYPENPLDFNDSGIFSSVFGRNPRWLLNRELGPLQPTLLSTTFACAAAFAKVRLGANLKPLSNFMHGVLGLPMGFMLVFRWNNAHERWWYGRTCLGNILFYCKNLGGTFCTWVAPDDPILAARALALINTLKECVADRLNGTSITDASVVQRLTTPLDSDDLEGLFGASNKVLFCLEALRGCVQEAFRRGYMPPAIASTVHAEVASIMDNYGSCEKVVNQPPPGCIITHLKCTLMVYVCSLPFILVHEVGVFGVVPVTTLLSLALFGIEAAAEQIEQPFGNRPYDLPVRALMRDNSRDLDQTSKRVLGFTGFVNGRRDLEIDKIVSAPNSLALNLEEEGNSTNNVQSEIGGKNKKIYDEEIRTREVPDQLDPFFEDRGKVVNSKTKASNARDWTESSLALGKNCNSSSDVFFTDNLRTSASSNTGISKDLQTLNVSSEDSGASTLTGSGNTDSSNTPMKPTLDWKREADDESTKSHAMNSHNLDSFSISPDSRVLINESSGIIYEKIKANGGTRKLPTWKTQAPIEIMDQVDERSVPDSPKYHTSRMRKANLDCDEYDHKINSAQTPGRNASVDRMSFTSPAGNNYSIGDIQLTPHPKVSRIIRSSPEGETDIRDIPHRDSFGLKKLGLDLDEKFVSISHKRNVRK